MWEDSPVARFLDDVAAPRLADVSDRGVSAWLREYCERQCLRVQPRTVPTWVAAVRAFDTIGVPMTVRQMFYALVSRGCIPKTEQGYDQVGYHLLRMRRTGLIPYRFIADNTRWMRKPRTYGSVREFLEKSQALYRRAIWDDLPGAVEIWIEKDALAGVVYQVTHRWDVPLMVTRGFSSETFVYEAAEAINASGKPTHVYYFGDWDPSGVAIPEDLRRKLERWTSLVKLTRVAVTREQIRRLGLHTRPTKRTDSRAKGWDGGSVELDAIPANLLRAMVDECIRFHVPHGHVEAMARVEAAERDTLARLSVIGAAPGADPGAVEEGPGA